MQYGYLVRDNDFGMQQRALEEYGCNEIVESDIAQLVQRLEPGDVIIVWRLDKLASDVLTLKHVISEVHQANCSVRSLSERFNSAKSDIDLLDRFIDLFSR